MVVCFLVCHEYKTVIKWPVLFSKLMSAESEPDHL